MRKCDICHTIIPPGQDNCPNCGYHYRPELKANGQQKEVEKKKYMAQFQPHPSPLDKTTKRVNKNYSMDLKKQKKIILMVVGGFIVSICIPVFTLIVKNTVNHYHNEIEDILDWEDHGETEVFSYANISTFNDLSFEFPEIGNEVQPYYELMLKHFDEEDIYEDYDIEQGYLSSAYISSDIFQGDYAVSFTVYKFDDAPWYQSANIYMQDLELKPEYFNEINRFFDIDENVLYNQCLTLYNRGKDKVNDVEDTYIFEEMDYGEYVITMALSEDATSKDLSFNIEKRLSE